MPHQSLWCLKTDKTKEIERKRNDYQTNIDAKLEMGIIKLNSIEADKLETH
jgi:hypothetical protein